MNQSFHTARTRAHKPACRPHATPRHARWAAAGGTLLAALLAPSAAHALSFTLTDLGPAPGFNPLYSAGRAITEQGTVVGHIGDGGINAQTAVWAAPAVEGTQRVGSYVPPLAGYRNSIADGINASGTMAGTVADGGPLAAVHRNGSWSILPSLYSIQVGGQAFDINDAGVIVGQDLPGNYGFPLRWLPDGNGGYTAQRLNGLGGGGRASAINASGQIAGGSNVGVLLGPSHAVLWQPDGSVTDLGVLNATGNHAQALGLNDTGLVVGESRNAQNKLEAFRWEGGVMTGMAAIPGWETYGFLGTVSALSTARDVNNAGWIVGEALRADGQKPGFLWRPGHGMEDLNSFISLADPFFSRSDVYQPNAGFRIEDAYAVNEAGQIVVTAVFNYVYPNTAVRQATHAFLLTPDVAPVPEPATAALTLLGLAGLAARARRIRAWPGSRSAAPSGRRR
jgi:probable HAF family extracellular repeat protein